MSREMKCGAMNHTGEAKDLLLVARGEVSGQKGWDDGQARQRPGQR